MILCSYINLVLPKYIVLYFIRAIFSSAYLLTDVQQPSRMANMCNILIIIKANTEIQSANKGAHNTI